MNRELFLNIMEIPTCSRNEERLRDFLVSYGIEKGYEINIDRKGNVFFKKGTIGDGEHYPCIVAHIDTVHRDQIPHIKENKKLLIGEDVRDGKQVVYAQKLVDGLLTDTGIGGDDKAGLYIGLMIMEALDVCMGAFFVEEEINMQGSRNANLDFVKDAGYFIQFDAPTNNWVSRHLSGVRLFDQTFEDKIIDILGAHGQTKISDTDPYTDVLILRKETDLCCINFFAGYMNMHTEDEYIVLDYVEEAINLGLAVIERLGKTKHEYIYEEKEEQ